MPVTLNVSGIFFFGMQNDLFGQYHFRCNFIDFIGHFSLCHYYPIHQRKNDAIFFAILMITSFFFPLSKNRYHYLRLKYHFS